MYQVLVFIHVASAIIWVGGAFFAQLLALRVARSDDPAELPRFGRNVEYLGTRVFLPASIVLFVAGILLVLQSPAWDFAQIWVGAAMGLWLVSALLGSLYIGPRSKRVAQLFEAEGPTSTSARALLDRLFLVSRLELVSLAVVVALMVFKPGSGAG